MPDKDRIVSRHFALIWVTLAALLIVFAVLYYVSGSNPFYSSMSLILVGALVGLIGGKAS